MQVIKSPSQVISKRPTVFLAGSIEMGKAEDWQAKAEAYLAVYDNFDIYNPRRDDWDPNWSQSISNPNFAYQVRWELSRLDLASIVLFYFAPGTLSPISLLELGRVLERRKGKNVVVCCPEGFWRKGNIELICDDYKIPLYLNLDDALAKLVI